MNIAQVLGALAVGRYQNFSRAAESLFLSQPALSLQISRLEAELGYPLFLRTAQGATLTEEGKAFCESAQSVANAWEQLQLTTEISRKRSQARLRISMGTRVYSNGLFDQVISFFDKHHDVEPVFITEVGVDFLSGLEAGSLDLALDRLPPQTLLHDPRRFFSCELIREEQCVLCSGNHPWAPYDEIAFSELQGCSLVTGLENSLEDRSMKEKFRASGVEPGRIYRSDGIDTIMSLVRGGKGITLGPRSFAAYYHVAAIPLEPKFEVSLCFICLRERAGDLEIAMLRRHLTRICRKNFPITG